MSLADRLKELGVSKPEKPQPLWKGPCSTDKHGGITFSMLSRYLVCKERFRVYAMEGIRPKEGFNHRIEYGNMWHVCEEALSQGKEMRFVIDELWKYSRSLMKKYPLAQEEIDKWYNVCDVQFPVYVDHWKEREKRDGYKALMEEQVFHVPYTLSSGRTVYLRGKWDGVLMSSDGVYLKEHKTKGDINQFDLQNQLTFDLQTMMYLVALNEAKGQGSSDQIPNWTRNCNGNIKGVIYNVVRRPLSGGKHTIVRHKATAKKVEESKGDYFQRLQGLIKDDPEFFFMRWNIEVFQNDIDKFRKVCLDPILENLVDDYEWWDHEYFSGVEDYDIHNSQMRIDTFPEHTPRHYRFPYGVWNVLTDGGTPDIDGYLDSGDMRGLRVTDKLFEELQ